MKKILFSALLLSVVFASCRKLKDVAPEPNKTTPTEAGTKEDSTLLLSLKATPMAYNIQTQTVKTSVTGNQLNLDFTEKVQLLIDADRYQSSWYVMFKEDYSKTTFANFDYKTTLAWDTVSTNWKPANLKQLKYTATDTTIAGAKVVNVKFTRVFTFYKTYANAGLAQDVMNSLTNKQEKITFLTRYEPDDNSSLYNSSTVNIVYKP